MWNNILEFIDKIGPLFYVIIPAIFGVYLNIRDKVNAKKAEVLKANTEKAQRYFDTFIHEESQEVILRIKQLCNYYKDRGHCDLVQYLQLENGTVASSKICNMFISCLTEDNRYGRVGKYLSKLQRVPYSRLSYLLSNVLDHKGDRDFIVVHNTIDGECYLKEFADMKDVNSYVILPVYDPACVFLGLVVFYYADENFNGHRQSELDLIKDFRVAVESVLLDYHTKRQNKKIQLGLCSRDSYD